MKIRPSYTRHSLMPLLVFSVTVHGFLFGLSASLKPQPEYAVVEARSSMEVVLLEEPQQKQPETAPQENVLTAEVSETRILQEEPREAKAAETRQSEAEEEIPQPVISPPDRGAVEKSRPEYLRNPAPLYPPLARQRGWQGQVTLRVLVDALGAAARVSVKQSSGRTVLDRAAVEAVRKWKFKPAGLGGIPLSVWIEIPFRFVLER